MSKLDKLTPVELYEGLLTQEKQLEYTKKLIKGLRGRLGPLYDKASKKYQAMLKGPYRGAKIEDIPCPCCGHKGLVATDLWLHTANSCKKCGWGMCD